MERTELEERGAKIIVEHLGVERERVKNEANLIDDLGADSLDAVELVMAFEEEFGVDLPDDQVEHAKTVGDLFDVVASKLAA